MLAWAMPFFAANLCKFPRKSPRVVKITVHRNFGGLYPAHTWNIFKSMLRLFLQNPTRLSLSFKKECNSSKLLHVLFRIHIQFCAISGKFSLNSESHLWVTL